MAKYIRLERPSEGVALVTMSNPDYQNLGSFAAICELADALREAREGGARISVLASDVEGHWFQHACLADLQRMQNGEPTEGDGMGWFNALVEVTHDDVVTIAAISGDCNGGGCELGWACDLRIAEEQACFGQPEVIINLATGIGGTSRLMHLIGRTATAEMVLDGAPLSARRIYELGGLNRVVAKGEATDAAVAWAERLAQRPHESLVALKQMLKAAEELPLSKALSNEQTLFQGVMASHGGREGMKRIQARIDAGESLREIYGNPRA